MNKPADQEDLDLVKPASGGVDLDEEHTRTGAPQRVDTVAEPQPHEQDVVGAHEGGRTATGGATAPIASPRASIIDGQIRFDVVDEERTVRSPPPPPRSPPPPVPAWHATGIDPDATGLYPVLLEEEEESGGFPPGLAVLNGGAKNGLSPTSAFILAPPARKHKHPAPPAPPVVAQVRRFLLFVPTKMKCFPQIEKGVGPLGYWDFQTVED